MVVDMLFALSAVMMIETCWLRAVEKAEAAAESGGV